ncbi:MAG TPA: TetR/AcrR family transcriptional regulator, partial [Actinomycetes bacterium]|nr:TetR/AcrR family transcriptional regulator [Actinomycetes bacterium]
LVGFDYVVGRGLARLFAERHPGPAADPVEAFLARAAGRQETPIGRLLAAAWREALAAVADGEAPGRARAALAALALEEAV